MLSERESIGQTLDLLTAGLYPYVEQELKRVYQDRWHDVALESFRDDRTASGLRGDVIRWDAHALLTVMWDQWNRVFRQQLGLAERSLVAELRDYRNRWAHQARFQFDDTYRILDSAARLLAAIDAPQAPRMHRDKHDLMRAHFNQEARTAYKRARIRRRKWKDFLVYAICCASIVFTILNFFGSDAWFLALFVVSVFVYLAGQRLLAPPPFYFGPHECINCHRIIYGEDCPYCENVQKAHQPGVAEAEAEAAAEAEEAAMAAERLADEQEARRTPAFNLRGGASETAAASAGHRPPPR